MKELLIDLMLFILSLIVLLLVIDIKRLKNKINDLEQRNLEVHEYILNKIEAPKGVYEKIQSNK